MGDVSGNGRSCRNGQVFFFFFRKHVLNLFVEVRDTVKISLLSAMVI